MKNIVCFFLFCCTLVSAAAQQSFTLLTPQPAQGSVVQFQYLPRNAVLQGVKGFEAVAYLMEGGLPRAVAVPLKQEGGLYKGSVQTTDTTLAVFFAFAKDEIRDNNNDSGYYTLLYNSGNPVMGAEPAAVFAG